MYKYEIPYAGFDIAVNVDDIIGSDITYNIRVLDAS